MAAARRRRPSPGPRRPEHGDRSETSGPAAGTAAGPQRQALAPLRSDFRVRFHDEAAVEPLHDATLRLLETTGMRFESPKALAILKKAGAKVDEGSDLVRLPRRLVEETLSLAPRAFTLGARDPSCDLQVGSGFTYGTTDGCGVEVIDWQTGERRSSTKADLEAITRMQDCLGSISFWWPTVSAGDCGETAQLHEIEAGWNNTSKHLMGMVQGETLARAAVEMATAVAGGADELRRRPVMSDLIGTVSPLLHDRDGIEAGLVFAEAGVPVCYVTMPNLGTTAPATKAGAFVARRGRDRRRGGAPRARRAGRPRDRVDHADLRRPAHGAHHDHAARRPLPLPRHRAAAQLRHPGARAVRRHRRRAARHLARRRRDDAAARCRSRSTGASSTPASGCSTPTTSSAPRT